MGSRSLMQRGCLFCLFQFLKFILNRRIITLLYRHLPCTTTQHGPATSVRVSPLCSPSHLRTPSEGSAVLTPAPRRSPGCPHPPQRPPPAQPPRLGLPLEAGTSLLTECPSLCSTLYSSPSAIPLGRPAPRRQIRVQPSLQPLLSLWPSSSRSLHLEVLASWHLRSLPGTTRGAQGQPLWC